MNLQIIQFVNKTQSAIFINMYAKRNVAEIHLKIDSSFEPMTAELAKEMQDAKIQANRSMETCGQCLQRGQLLSCSKCQVMKYCNSDCQKQNWPQHKSECSDFAAKKQVADAKGVFCYVSYIVK